MKEVKDQPPKTPKKPLVFYYLIVMIVVMLLNALLFPSMLNRQVTQVSYDTFLQMVDEGKVSEVAWEKDGEELVFIAKDADGKDAYYKTGVWPDTGEWLLEKLQSTAGVTFEASIPTQTSPLLSFILTWVLPIFMFIVIGELLSRWMLKKMGGQLPGGLGNAMTFGKADAKVYVEQAETGVTFADVAGQDEAKESLKEVVDFLHNPEKYAEVGAKLPKGVLLVGPPGTGKTLLAKAVAGEAGVPFFSISGSEFVEMFVGMGAAKVRDLFKQANEKAPCIVFIDEIDTIGKKRDGGAYGGNDEREQTLNQLLAEMDGFDGRKGVVLLAATNRPETLDPALTRPGRFDRRVPVELPDLRGRVAILKVHAKDVKIAEDVDFDVIARATAGASGAELANIINEAALRAVRQGRKLVLQEDLEESVETVIAGAQRKNAVLSPQEKKIVAYHETGHALVAALQSHSAPVTKITIVPRTSGALGYTMQVDTGERSLMSRQELLEQDRHPNRRPGRRGADLRPGRHDHRRIQRHRAGYQAGPGHDHPVRYDRRVRHGGAGDGEQPVSGRGHLPCLRRGDRRPHRCPCGGYRQERPRQGGEAPAGQRGQAPRDRPVPAGKGDHHRRGVHEAAQRLNGQIITKQQPVRIADGLLFYCSTTPDFR